MNWTLLQNSLLLTAVATSGAVAMGFFAALWLAVLDERFRRWFLAAAVIALALPPFFVTSCWLEFFGYSGAWREWLPFDLYSLWGAGWIMMSMTWPITMFLVLADWGRLSPSQLEADPRLRGWPLLRWLLLPMARSGLGQATVLTLVLTLNNFAVPAILQTKVFPAELWVSFNTTLDYAAALKIAWPLLVAPLMAVIWLNRRAIEWPRLEGFAPPALLRSRVGKTWFAISGASSISILLLSVAMPLKELIFSARTWRELPAAFLAGQSAFGNSLILAALGATSCLLVGLALWRRFWPNVFWGTFLLPGILIGIGLSFALNRPGLGVIYQSMAVVILGLTLRFGVLGWKGARHALDSIDSDLTATAKLNDRVSKIELLRYVYWPQTGAQLAAVWYVIYLLCLWDVETLIFIIPPGRETLAMRIFNLLHYGHNSQVNALCLILLGLALTPWLAWQAWRCAEARLPRLRLALAGCIALAGCSPVASNQAPIESKLFSAVQIIGSMGTGVGQFNKPRSVAVDANDNLYVVDMTGRVQKFSSNGTFVSLWQMPQTDKGKPKGMCRDLAGNIVVVEPHYSRVNHFSPDGKLVAQWGAHGTNAGALTLPRAVAVNSRGEIFVSEYTQAERVQKFGADGKQFLLAFGHSGDDKGEFNRPEGLAVDAKDRVYVADSCNHRIQIFSGGGQFVASYGRAGTALGELSYPYDIRVDAAGRQYVCEFGNSRVQVFDDHNQPIEILGRMGSEPGQFSNPWGLVLDSKGNLYVADSRNHRVQKFIRRRDHALTEERATPRAKS